MDENKEKKTRSKDNTAGLKIAEPVVIPEKLSDFNKKLKKAIKYNHKKKD